MPRRPTPSDVATALNHLAKHPDDKKRAYENVLWALLNTKEFHLSITEATAQRTCSGRPTCLTMMKLRAVGFTRAGDMGERVAFLSGCGSVFRTLSFPAVEFAEADAAAFAAALTPLGFPRGAANDTRRERRHEDDGRIPPAPPRQDPPAR